MIDRQNLTRFFDDRKKAYWFVVSVVLLIIFILIIFIIPQINSIEGLIGSNPTVATLNGQPLTRSQLILYNCNRHGVYLSQCKTNYQGQLNNFINYKVAYQYLKSHNDLPTKTEVYSVNNITNTVSGMPITLSKQTYNYFYQNLVKTNIENLLEKNVSGTVVGAVYSLYSSGSSGTIPYGGRKNYAKALINMWRTNVIKNQAYVQNIENFLVNSPYLGFVTKYQNLNFNNYPSKLNTYTNFPMFTNAMNQKSNKVSPIYSYNNNDVKNVGNNLIAMYYFIIPNKSKGVYSNYSKMINSLRSKDNIVVY
ncbi:MAG: hypothetical protein ACYDBX_00520 [Patescibacteria group bacterium]